MSTTNERTTVFGEGTDIAKMSRRAGRVELIGVTTTLSDFFGECSVELTVKTQAGKERTIWLSPVTVKSILAARRAALASDLAGGTGGYGWTEGASSIQP